MPLAGQAVVAIWNDITPEQRDAFFEWHPREHMNERLGIPGFLRGRRYIAIEGDIQFFTLYEAESKAVLTGEQYQKRLNAPTPWSLAVLPGFRNNLRGVCDVAFSKGHADGGTLWTARFKPELGREDEVRHALTSYLLEGVVERPKVTGAHLLICDQSLSGTNTSLQRGRTITTPDWVILVEGSDSRSVSEACQDRLSAKELQAQGAISDINIGLYQLEYQVSRLTVREINL